MERTETAPLIVLIWDLAACSAMQATALEGFTVGALQLTVMTEHILPVVHTQNTGSCPAHG
jgi:hypothetical protein